MISGQIDTATQPQADAEALDAGAGENDRTMLIVQFDGPIRPEWIAACEAAGAVFHQYLPQFAYLVTLPADSDLLDRVKSAGGVSWVGVLAPEQKISPGLSQAAAGEVKITILSLDDTPRRVLEQQGFVVTSSRMTPMGWQDTRVTIPASQLSQVAPIWGVFHIEPQPQFVLHGERGAQSAGGSYLPGASEPASPGYADWLASHGLSGAPGVIVQVQDTGLGQGDASNQPGTAHVDLVGRIAGIFNATSDATGDDVSGHGTLNAGIIMGNAQVGTRDQGGYLLGQGMAPQASVYATKIFQNIGFFDIGSSSLTDLATAASRAGATFSNNSWGANVRGAYTAESAEFDMLTRDADPVLPGNQQMTYFFSASNAGPNEMTLGSPASAKNVIAVGAGENSDRDGTDLSGIGPTGSDSIRDLISFSGRGPTQDGRLGVTLFSVGTHVQGPASTSPSYDGTGVSNPFWPPGQTDYARSSGTSHSAPMAAGAGMLVHELFSTQLAAFGHTGNPSPALIKAVLVNTATDMAGGSDGRGGTLEPIPNPNQGWGSVNLSTLMDAKKNLFSFDQALAFSFSGDFWEEQIVVADPSKPLKITLAWTDAPGNPLAAPVLVNDLDLSVIGARSTFLGNVFANGFSSRGGSPDRLNNLESVYIENPSGIYTVRVDAFNIAGDGVPGEGGLLDQDFAIFVWNGRAQSSPGIVDMAGLALNC
ncbi:S8 family serine peptidase, partial [Candidatus Sumerlaeota bacterium]|nr:S8 family serine peptidase [Candidatus Sumerlaeota bacterium]